MATVIGTDGNDFIDDTLGVTAGPDDINGGLGSDTIVGGGGADNITGGPGADFFFGAIQDLNGDTITDFQVGTEQSGADRISVQFGNIDVPSVSLSTQGNDLRVTISQGAFTSNITLAGLATLSNPGFVIAQNDGLFSGDIFITNTGDGGGVGGGGGDDGGNDQPVGGGAFDDLVPTITDDDNGNLIFGTDGNDIIDAAGGNDTIVTSPGNDIIITGEGADVFFGQAGSLSGTTIVDFTTGTGPTADAINVSLANASDLSVTSEVSGTDLLVNINTNGTQDQVVLAGLGVQGTTVTFSTQPGAIDGTSIFVSINTNNNAAPTATDDVIAVTDGTPATGNIVTGDNGNGVDSDDAVGNPLTITEVTVGDTTTAISADATSVDLPNGTLAIDPDGDFTYTSDAGVTGTDTLTYTITDGLATDTATVTFNVGTGNEAPTPADDTFAVALGSTLNRTAANGVLANDTDPENNALTVAAVNGDAAAVGVATALTNNGANAGTLTLNADGSLSFIPSPTSTGATFTYTASDGVDTATATVTINIGSGGGGGGGGGGGSTVDAIADEFTAELGTLFQLDAASGLLANDSPSGIVVTQIDDTAVTSDGTLVSIRNAQDVEQGVLEVNLDGSLSFANAQGNEDPVSFNYTISDGTETDVATVTIGFGVEFAEIGTDAADTFNRAGSTANNSIDAVAGNDRIITGVGDDSISGGDGDDFIDDIDGQDAGDNILLGGNGNDTIFGRAGSYDIDGEGGNDQITVYAALGTNTVDGGDGNDTIELRRGTDNTIDGGAGDDNILIRKTIFNEIGLQNTIFGGAGNDTIEIRDGYANTIDGGTGNDVLIAGSGGDTFVFASGFGNDVLRNFGRQGADKIDLSAFAGLDFATFQSQVAETSEGTFVWTASTGDTLTIEDLPFDTLSSVFFTFEGA